MEDDWESKFDEEKLAPPPKDAKVNKWDGEDEEEVIDSWEDVLEEKKDEEKNDAPVVVKSKKTLTQKLAEKETLRRELEEKRRKEREEEEMADMTPEERAAEKIRRQLAQEEADLKTALESLGMINKQNSDNNSGLDAFSPKTKSDFEEFATAITKKVDQFRNSEEFVPFLDVLVFKLCVGLSSTNIRKIRSSLDVLHLEKQKNERGDKPKKKAGGKVKASIKTEKDNDFTSQTKANFDYDDMDDFM
ncbi:unnamed protein product [Diamesa serratosioi]